VRQGISSFYYFSSLVHKAVCRDKAWQRKDVQNVTLRQIYFGGFEALKLISVLAVIFGYVLVSKSSHPILMFGNSEIVSPLMLGLLMRDIAPLLTIFVVISRSVTSVASELSAMKSSGEVEALKASGVSPLQYLVVPRVIGGALSTFFLAIHFVFLSLFTGALISSFNNSFNWVSFVHVIFSSVNAAYIFLFVLKTLILGAFIFLLACFFGLRVKGVSFEIPQATNRAVMNSFLAALSTQLLLSLFYYLALYMLKTGAL
jgi:phospholipid/cholesterol/gamma-HCH transport system permease protein